MNRLEREQKVKDDEVKRLKKLRELMEIFVIEDYKALGKPGSPWWRFHKGKWVGKVKAMTDLELAREFELRDGPESWCAGEMKALAKRTTPYSFPGSMGLKP